MKSEELKLLNDLVDHVVNLRNEVHALHRDVQALKSGSTTNAERAQIKAIEVDQDLRCRLSKMRSEEAYQMARDNPEYPLQDLQKIVIDSDNPYLAYRFAKDIPGADIAALQAVVLKNGTGKALTDFATDIPLADIEALQAEVLRRGKYTYTDALKFAYRVKGADIGKIQEKILQSENAEVIFDFAHRVDGADLEKIYHCLMNLRTYNQDDGYANRFNRDDKLQLKLINFHKDRVSNILSGMAVSEIVDILDTIDDVDMPYVQEHVIRIGSAEDIHHFGVLVERSDRQKIQSKLDEMAEDGTDEGFADMFRSFTRNRAQYKPQTR